MTSLAEDGGVGGWKGWQDKEATRISAPNPEIWMVEDSSIRLGVAMYYFSPCCPQIYSLLVAGVTIQKFRVG